MVTLQGEDAIGGPTTKIFTDASGPVKGMAGIGIVSTNMLFPEMSEGIPYIVPSSDVAELYGLMRAIETLNEIRDRDPRGLGRLIKKIVIFSDSKNAIRKTKRMMASGKLPRSSTVIDARLLKALQSIGESTPISFSWVKGHDDAEYNEKADKLARAGRLSLQAMMRGTRQARRK